VVDVRPHWLSQVTTVAGLAAGGLLISVLGGPAGGPVAAVFPPWWSAARAVEAAGNGGTVLRLGPADFVVFVAPDEARGPERLRQAGAWLLLNPRGVTGCSSTRK
jgi:hypothetical protein